MKSSTILTYTGLSRLNTYEDRLRYLLLGDKVGSGAFNFDRWLEEKFYKSYEWKRIRRDVIIRDNGCDLGIDGLDINKGIIIHHMNPITVEDITNRSEFALNPEYLICVSDETHRRIHYGNAIQNGNPNEIIERTPGDTTLWKTI